MSEQETKAPEPAAADAQVLEKVVRSQKQWQSIVDAITDYLFVVDEQGRLVKMNNAFAGAFGQHPRELVGQRCFDLLECSKTKECSIQEIIKTGTPRIFEKNVQGRFYQVSIYPMRDDRRWLAVHIMKDISEVKRFKARLYQTEKLTAIGELVSGVAHEINNPLTGVVSFTELLRMKVTDDEVQADLVKIQNSAERCKKIVDNLLTFSQQNAPVKGVESVSDIIDRAIELRAYWLRRERIEIARRYDATSTVYVDARQMQEAILNILLNAEQAIVGCGRKDGKIEFATRSDGQRRRTIISIRDNGPGVRDEDLPLLFDPFFTTKPVGVASGLGLPVAYGIVAQHGGDLRLENAPGGGVLVTIEIPVGI